MILSFQISFLKTITLQKQTLAKYFLMQISQYKLKIPQLEIILRTNKTVVWLNSSLSIRSKFLTIWRYIYQSLQFLVLMHN